MYWVGCSVCQTLLANLGKINWESCVTPYYVNHILLSLVTNPLIFLELNITLLSCLWIRLSNNAIIFIKLSAFYQSCDTLFHEATSSLQFLLIFFFTRKQWFCKLISKESFAFQEQEHRSSVSSQSSQVASPKHSPLSTTLQQTPSIQNSDGKHFLGKRWTLKPSYHGC